MTPVTNPNLHAQMKAAYLKNEARFAALPASEHIPITMDVALTFTTSHGKLMQIPELRQRVLALPGIHRERVEEVEELLLAFGYAQAQYSNHFAPTAAIPALHEKVVKSRQVLANAVEALADVGLVPGDRRVDIKGNASRDAIALDVIGTVGQLVERWPSIEGKTALTREQLERFANDAGDLLEAIGARRSDTSHRISHNRNAALTLFARSWDQLRRGVSYERWEEGDVDDFLPPLHSNRVQRPKKTAPADDTVEPSPPTSAPAAPKPSAPSDDDESPFTS